MPSARRHFQPCIWQVSTPSLDRSAEARQVGLEVRAAPLHLPAVQHDRLGGLGRVLLGEPALGVVEPLLGQALEEHVDELVVRPDALRGEPAGQEQRVDPVDLVLGDQLLEVGPPGAEPVAHLLARVRAHLAGDEVEQDVDVAALGVLGR